MIKKIQKILESIGRFNGGYEIQEIKESNNNQVFCHNDIICKINNNSKNLELEYNVLKTIVGNGIFPKAIHYCKSGDKYFLFMEKLSGKGIEYEWKNLVLVQKEEIIRQIVENMKIIHSYSSHSSISYLESCKENFIIYYEKVKNNPYINNDELYEVLVVFLNKIEKCNNNNTDVLVHHDLWHKNILVNQGKLTGMIDFETALYAPKEIELFRLFHHKDCAQNYIDSGSEEYTEIEYLDMLLDTIKIEYPELCLFEKDLFDCYNLESYMQKLSRYDEQRYNHDAVMRFYKIFCLQKNLTFIGDIIDNNGVIGDGETRTRV